MPWFKVDDQFDANKKVKSIPRRNRAKALGLWVQAGAWCARELTDGFVPKYMIDEFAVTLKVADELVTAGLWALADGGFQFINWDEFQPTAGEVESKRDADRRRKAQWREAKKAKSERGSEGEELNSNEVFSERNYIQDGLRKSNHNFTDRPVDNLKGDFPPNQNGTASNNEKMSQRDTYGTDSVTPMGLTESSALPDPTRPDPTYSIDRSSQPSNGDHARGDGLAESLNLDDLAAATRRARAAGFDDAAVSAGLAEFHKRPEPKGAGLLRVLIEEFGNQQKDLSTKQREREARRAAIDACPRCDNNGMRPTAAGATRCTHEVSQPPFAQGA